MRATMGRFAQRTITDILGLQVDRTIDLKKYLSGKVTLTFAVGDYIYIGSLLPFNNKYIEIDSGQGNTLANNLAFEFWTSGQTWASVVDLIDETRAGGASFANSGHFSYAFDPESSKSWSVEDRTDDIPALTDFQIYNLYWSRLSFDSASDSIDLNYVGQRFCVDEDMYNRYPSLNNTKIIERVEGSGATTWKNKHIAASDVIIDDLMSRNNIVTGDQVLDVERFKLACAHKSAELIFASMGSAFVEDETAARVKYQKEMNQSNFNVDLNNNAVLDNAERALGNEFMGR
jgi:hypothetical protein